MGGTFALTSTPGRGLAAHIRMPRAMPAPPRPAQPPVRKL
jgi:two-component system osmolarity sensor histidine kinase EnvZ